jgi:hypothetical protein
MRKFHFAGFTFYALGWTSCRKGLYGSLDPQGELEAVAVAVAVAVAEVDATVLATALE